MSRAVAILAWVEAETGVPIGAITGPTRSPEVVRVRTLAIWGIRSVTGLNPGAIGDRVKRERTTVMAALTRAHGLILSDALFRDQASRLWARFMLGDEQRGVFA